jgi:hypothetical protein
MMAVVTGRDTAKLLAAGFALHADAVGAEAAEALRAAGIASILLRGRVISHHLYDRSEVRSYADADLLVEEQNRAGAEAVLRGLGYEHRAVLGQRAADRPPWSSTWVRTRDEGEVDLHWTLVGIREGPETVWEVLSAEVQPIEPSGLVGLSAAATAFVVSLHAAHHGTASRRPVEDLQRAVARFPRVVWRAAAELAERLDASEAMSAGLRIAPHGAELADELGLPAVASVETMLRAQSAPPTALGFEWLARTSGVRKKVVLVAGKVFPDREFMRAWFRPAGESTAGLVVGYVWRPVWLAWHTVPGLRAWLRARRRTEPLRRRV